MCWCVGALIVGFVDTATHRQKRRHQHQQDHHTLEASFAGFDFVQVRLLTAVLVDTDWCVLCKYAVSYDRDSGDNGERTFRTKRSKMNPNLGPPNRM